MNNIQDDIAVSMPSPASAKTAFFHLSLRDTWILVGLTFLLFLAVNGSFLWHWSRFDFGFFTMVKRTYAFNTLIFPVLLLFSGTWVLLISRVNRQDRRLSAIGIGFIVCAFFFVGLRVYATHYEPHRLVLRTVTIESPKIKQPLRVLHITDIQSDRVGDYEKRVFARIQELKPDLVIHTGDLIQPIRPATFESELPKMVELFQTLNIPLGVYSIIGDADEGLMGLTKEELGGCQLLENETAVIELMGFRLNLYGLTLDQSAQGYPAGVRQWLDKANPEDFTILIGHRPDFVLHHNEDEIDLCLAGHTHGGQVRIPFVGPLSIASDIPRDWARGYREVGNTRLNVSAGVGCEHAEELPDIRVFCPSEMTLFELLPAEKSGFIAYPVMGKSSVPLWGAGVPARTL